MMRIFSLFIVILFFFQPKTSGQGRIIDEVVAVVGDKRLLYSDVEQNYLQLKAQGENTVDLSKCQLLEDLLVQKLLLNQSEVDSIEVTDSQIDIELDSRLQYFINAMGSEEKLEDYFKKTTLEIKEDMRAQIREQMLTNEMRKKITEGIAVTPSEVRAYYKSLPVDSLPYINAEVEYNQILIHPRSNEQAIIDVREKMLSIRERIMKGESFATLAVINSEDPGSAVKGGDIGWLSRAELDPEYAKAAFALKKGSVSKIVESSFGFHLIQCLDRTEDRIHTRHILLRPKVTDQEKQEAVSRLDSIVRLVRLDSLKFDIAAMRYSQDEDTRINGGQAVNRYKGGTHWGMDEFDPVEYKIINNLKIGEISDPYQAMDSKGKLTYKVIWLKNRTNPHIGDLKSDYNLFKAKALQLKQKQIVNNWVEDKIKTTYIRLSDKYKTCSFSLSGWLKS